MMDTPETLTDPTPAALYARVSSDRQDVDLSVASQLRALRDYARKNGYIVAREYVDEAGSGHIADRPEELEAEISEAGFDERSLYSVKGPGELATGLEGRMSDPTRRAQLLDLIRSVEQERNLLGVSR